MGATKRVLLVDDDIDFVAIHKAVLENNGYQVAVAHDGAQCLQEVEAEKPDLIVLDIMMRTVGEGMFVAQGLRKDEATKDIPIIVVTSVNQVRPFNIGPDEGWLPVDVFVEKPILPEVLLDQVRKALGQQTTHIERGS